MLPLKTVKFSSSHPLQKECKEKKESALGGPQCFLWLDVGHCWIVLDFFAYESKFVGHTNACSDVLSHFPPLFLFNNEPSLSTIAKASRWCLLKKRASNFLFCNNSQGIPGKSCVRTLVKINVLCTRNSAKLIVDHLRVEQWGQHWDIHFRLHPCTSWQGSVVAWYTCSTAAYFTVLAWKGY